VDGVAGLYVIIDGADTQGKKYTRISGDRTRVTEARRGEENRPTSDGVEGKT
jgi:hypothetical protein